MRLTRLGTPLAVAAALLTAAAPARAADEPLHPAVTKVSPASFSPNGDGRFDTTTATYTLDVAQSVVVRVKTAGGTTVRSARLGTQAAGTHTWVWNGKGNDGTRVAHGTYTVELTTTDGTRTGSASRTVKVDLVAPWLSDVSGAGTTTYPYVDGYRDTFPPAVTINEAARLTLTVYVENGPRVRTIDGGIKPAGRHRVAWNGRRADGSAVPAGRYSYVYTAKDFAQNARSTGRYLVKVSWQRLVARNGSTTVYPSASYERNAGSCSRWFSPAPGTGWAGSAAHYSNYACATPGQDYVWSQHSAAIPWAIRYGGFRVTTTGGRASTAHPGYSKITYLDQYGGTTAHVATLYPTYGGYVGPTVPLAGMMPGGKTVAWRVETSGGNWYRFREFTVTWRYYVLV